MTILTTAAAIIGLGALTANAVKFPYLNDTTIHQPQKGKEQLSYPRYVELMDETILVTISHRSYEATTTNAETLAQAYFPVFSSSDGGASWEWISNITDMVNGWGLGAQPALMELTEAMGDYPEGTVLAAGNSWSDNGTRIDVYSSADKGHTWKFVSQVAQGSAPNTTNGAHPIWEPYLMMYESSVVCYYSDQRDPLHGQKLAHQVTTDLMNWGPVVNDVAYPTYADRPGMTIITQLGDGSWILVHEYPGGYSYGLANYPVYYHIADSPLNFISDPGRPVLARGFQPSSSPYVQWSPLGGPNGTIVVSDADHNGVFLNTMLGDSDGWRYHLPDPYIARAAYSRAIAIWRNHPHKLGILSGAMYNDASTNLSRPLSLTTLDLDALIRGNVPPTITPLEVYYPKIDKLAA